MARIALAALLAALSGVAHAGAGASASSSEGAAVVTIRLVARVVSTTWIEVDGRGDTELIPEGAGRAMVDLGAVDSEGALGRRGRAVERADDQGAFHTADLAARVRFDRGATGRLFVGPGGELPVAPGLDHLVSCGEVPTSALRQAQGSAPDGTRSLADGTHPCAELGPGENVVPVQLAVHVGDETPDGTYAAAYLFTAVPDVF